MENKQTAVEWLFDKITQNKDIRWRGTQYRELFEQAKAMEENQHFHTWYKSIANDRHEGDEPNINFYQYYKETYGK